VVLPLSVVISLWLLRHHSHRVLVPWIIALGLCIAVTALLKTYLYACPIGSDLVSPSGHTSLSTLTYGAMTLVIAAEERRILQTSVLARCRSRLYFLYCRLARLAQRAQRARSWYRDPNRHCDPGFVRSVLPALAKRGNPAADAGLAGSRGYYRLPRSGGTHRIGPARHQPPSPSRRIRLHPMSVQTALIAEHSGQLAQHVL
jgi:hypothetical protein